MIFSPPTKGFTTDRNTPKNVRDILFQFVKHGTNTLHAALIFPTSVHVLPSCRREALLIHLYIVVGGNEMLWESDRSFVSDNGH
jgi:hypothetical protein